MTPTHPGKVVADRFEIGRVAGSGGMGVVYQAQDRETERAVALKVLLERDQGPADRFAHEVELLSTLDHPHIIGYVSHGLTADGAPFLVMPWLEGMDLLERLRTGPLSIDETLVLARHVAGALACLHERGLVHRDLKPSNLFLPLGKVDDVQVIDLGVARPSAASLGLTQSGALIGTPGYIAPEQARGDREIAPTVDIFALGCVLFECLTGRRLFSGSHLMSVLAKILLEDPPRVSELRPDAPAALDLLVHRMVAKDPAKRPRDGAELRRWLEDLDRTPSLDGHALAQHTITESERRVVTVLVVVLPAIRGSIRPPGGETRVDADPFQSSSARFGVRAHLLAERTAIALAPETASAADQAAILTRFARYVVETFIGARVALTTGSALTGGRLPVGEAIDRAVTMVRAARAAEGVSIDDVTAALITSRFDVRREGERLFVHAERFSLDPTRPLLGKPTSCVGRERELSILESALMECSHGDGPKVVLLTAAAGAGKSRVRHELVRRLTAKALAPLVLECRGDPLHSATPYAMVAQLVRQAAGLREREPAEVGRGKLWAHVAELVPEADAPRVSDFLGELVGTTFDDEGRLPLRAARHNAEAMADQVGRAFEDIVRGWSAKQAVMLMLEDLHWCDVASVKVLERTLRKLPGANVFVLALARPEVHDRFPTLFANRDVTLVRLPPIPKRACARLVYEVMGEGNNPTSVDRIVERSEGNGFYLEELIRASAERPGAHASETNDFPDTVIAVAQARLERLEPAVRKVLRAASIYGNLFALEGVSALVGSELSVLEPIMRALVDEEAIAPLENPRLANVREYCFRHALLRGTAYTTLTAEDRTLGHRLAAAWLEQVGEDQEIVATHWLEGGDRARAAASFAQAGEARWLRAQADAAARCAARSLLVGDPSLEPPESIAARVRLFARALEASRSIDSRDVISGLERHLVLTDPPPGTHNVVVSAALAPSLEVTRKAGDDRILPEMFAHAACAFGAVGDGATARALLAEATAVAAGHGPTLRPVVQASAKVAFWMGEMGGAVDLLEEMILPEAPRARLESLLLLAIAVVTVDGLSALARGLDYVTRAEAILAVPADGRHSVDSVQDDPAARAHCAKARFFCFCYAGEYALAAEAARSALVIARGAGLRWDECAHLHNAGEQYLRLGERERARSTILESNEIARDIGAVRSQKHNEVLLTFLDGDGDRLDQLAEEARVTKDPWLELYARYWLGHLLVSANPREARDVLAQALRLARELKVRMMVDDCTKALAALGTA